MNSARRLRWRVRSPANDSSAAVAPLAQSSITGAASVSSNVSCSQAERPNVGSTRCNAAIRWRIRRLGSSSSASSVNQAQGMSCAVRCRCQRLNKVDLPYPAGALMTAARIRPSSMAGVGSSCGRSTTWAAPTSANNFDSSTPGTWAGSGKACSGWTLTPVIGKDLGERGKRAGFTPCGRPAASRSSCPCPSTAFRGRLVMAMHAPTVRGRRGRLARAGAAPRRERRARLLVGRRPHRSLHACSASRHRRRSPRMRRRSGASTTMIQSTPLGGCIPRAACPPSPPQSRPLHAAISKHWANRLQSLTFALLRGPHGNLRLPPPRADADLV